MWATDVTHPLADLDVAALLFISQPLKHTQQQQIKPHLCDTSRTKLMNNALNVAVRGSFLQIFFFEWSCFDIKIQ